MRNTLPPGFVDETGRFAGFRRHEDQPPRTRWPTLGFVVSWVAVLCVFAGIGLAFSLVHQSQPLMHFRIDLGDGREVLISTKDKPYIDADKWGGGTTVVIGNHRWDTQGDVHIERIWEPEGE